MHLQDYMHTYYQRGIVLQDNEQKLFEWQDAFFNADVQALSELGWTHVLHEKTTLATGVSGSTGFLSHLTLPTATFSSILTIVGAKDLLIERFLGGSFSGGTPISQFPTNLDNPQDVPNQTAAVGVTIDVAGALIFSDEILGTGAGSDEEITGGGFIMPPNAVNYVTYTNNDAASVDLEISYLMSALPGSPS